MSRGIEPSASMLGKVEAMQRSPKRTLNDGAEIDALGYGVYKVPSADCELLVGTAIETGYRTIDTAALYGNEAGVGAAVRQAVSAGMDRSELFITSKVWNDQQGYDKTLRAFDDSMERLGLDYLDLFLIHWPAPRQDLYRESYRAMEKLQKEGRVSSIGVSNFQISHLERLLETADVVPAVNQIELHPWLQQKQLREYNSTHGIATQAWSPLARGQIFAEPALAEIAANNGKSIAQVVLRWHYQSNLLVIPKASSRVRMEENINVFDFELSQADMDSIDLLDKDKRVGSHPDEVN